MPPVREAGIRTEGGDQVGGKIGDIPHGGGGWEGGVIQLLVRNQCLL